MATCLYLAPAGSGKTAFALKMAIEQSRSLDSEVRVCVASRLQAYSWKKRLAEMGGALGIRVYTFDQLYDACLDAAGVSYTRLSQPVQYRLVSNVIQQTNLVHYRSIRDRPGFIQIVQSFLEEIKGSRIFPDKFLKAVLQLGDEPRLRELGLIYDNYQLYLQDHEWADFAGIGWLAVEVLESQSPDVGTNWPLLIVDGFDDFTEIQLALLRVLADRVGSMVITMTGEFGREEPRTVHRRFARTHTKLKKYLDISAEPLPRRFQAVSTVFSHLESNLFSGDVFQGDPEERVKLIEAADRATEAREALRWIKKLIVNNNYKPGDVALVARDLTPYRPFILETAAEFQIPIRIVDGLPLRSNPAIVALLNLLHLVLPPRDSTDGYVLPRSGVVAAWRSPYFDWENALPNKDVVEPIGIIPADADLLDSAGRWGRVIRGHDQWQEALSALAGRDPENQADEDDLPANVVAGEDAVLLQRKFNQFFELIKPPDGRNRYRDYIRWLEDLIGSELDPHESTFERAFVSSLNMVEMLGQVQESHADIAALRRFKEIMRGLYWAEMAMADDQLVDYPTFLAELTGTVEGTSYQPQDQNDQEGILAGSLIRLRGLPFRAVALLGLAEGEFPAVLKEDPLLREADRSSLDEMADLDLTSSIESAEQEFFYEAITSARERLLITRPRISDSGAEWLASPFWDEIYRLIPINASTQSLAGSPTQSEACSLPELMESQIRHHKSQSTQEWIFAHHPDQWSNLVEAGRIFLERYDHQYTIYDGDLRRFPSVFNDHFSPEYAWSPSSLESYRSCSFMFFISRALRLKVRQEPAEGLDAAQSGTLYHEILEQIYRSYPNLADPTFLETAEGIIKEIARPILESAPRELGFREVAWWQQIKQEILENIDQTIGRLAETPGNFKPVRLEAYFSGQSALIVLEGEDSFRIHGLVDRIDQNPRGELRIIDYKTSGSYSYSKRSLLNGEKLQLPLYARAAQVALDLGDPVEGFYWHIYQAEPSGLSLAEFGPEEAMKTAEEFAWEAVHGARKGDFRPEPPPGGCPNWCPAASFCWQYQPSGWK